MTYDGSSGERSAVWRPAAGVETLTVGPATAGLVATGSLTSSRYGLFRWDMAPGSGGPEPHFHRTFSEAFYVLAGTVRLHDGGTWFDAGAGDFVYVPEGGVHAFRNDGDEPASMLILFAPGAAREEYFKELAGIRAERRTLTAEEWTDLYARHDQSMV